MAAWRIARGRLAAVVAVGRCPTLELPDPRRERELLGEQEIEELEHGLAALVVGFGDRLPSDESSACHKSTPLGSHQQPTEQTHYGLLDKAPTK